MYEGFVEACGVPPVNSVHSGGECLFVGGLVYKHCVNRPGYATASWLIELSWVLFLGVCLVFYYYLVFVCIPIFGLYFLGCAVA